MNKQEFKECYSVALENENNLNRFFEECCNQVIFIEENAKFIHKENDYAETMVTLAQTKSVLSDIALVIANKYNNFVPTNVFVEEILNNKTTIDYGSFESTDIHNAYKCACKIRNEIFKSNIDLEDTREEEYAI